MNTTLLEQNNNAQLETWDGKIDLPGLLMRLDANKVSLRRTYPGIGLYPVTRISPAMEEAVKRYQSDLWRIAAWWGITDFIQNAPVVFQ